MTLIDCKQKNTQTDFENNNIIIFMHNTSIEVFVIEANLAYHWND